ncbi:4'-phosphopantetheinyl transferase superfamily protein [Legionella jordanis]|nr:4'-phosphopantetheinyl transferase superfamily protein [Legionella jordanis]RMX19179.1 4'-phosphopantetheinyl transferase superfamily protein [Legionella jordanis]
MLMPLFKAMSVRDCCLSPSRIDVWEFPLTQFAQPALLLLNEDEQAKGNRFRFEHHRRRYRVARAMMRIILGKYLNCPPEHLQFDYNSHGKPEIKSKEAIEFNLSHSGELALLAVGQHTPLGIDLEFFSARPYEGIAKHSFSPQECAALAKVPIQLKPLSFFSIWSQKEALIKACGLGLSYPTQRFNVPILPAAQEEIVDSLHETVWQMRCFMPQISCCAALCFQPQIEVIRYLKVNPLDFFKAEEI